MAAWLVSYACKLSSPKVKPHPQPYSWISLATLKISQLCLSVVDQLEFIVVLTLIHYSFCSLRRKDY